MSGVDILKELKQLDYELFCRMNKSHLSEDQWDWLIEQFELMKSIKDKNKK